MKPNEQLRTSLRHLAKQEAWQALRLADDLLASDEESTRVAGHICKGLIYEHGGNEFPIDLDRALQHYRQVALVIRDQTTYCDMARTTMKKGPAHFEQGLRYLEEARAIKDGPDVDLGFAEYFKSKPNPDYPQSRRFYARAAWHGRFMGFFGYSDVSRTMGQHWRAFAVDVLRLLLGPFIALLIGSRATGRF